VVRLERNYRSTANILAAADSLIRHNRRRAGKDLIAENAGGQLVTILSHRDDEAEARGVAEAVRRQVDDGKRRYRDFAVFVRVGSLSRTIEAALRAARIPYQVVGGASFFERKEIRDVLAYARLLVNPRDDEALERIVNTPPRGVGETSLQKLRAYARSRGIPLSEALRDAASAGVRGKPLAAVRDFRLLLDELSAVAGLGPQAALSTVIDRTEYRKLLEGCAEEEEQDRLANLQDMLNSAAAFEQTHPEADLVEFLQSISLASDSDRRDDANDLVSVMTLHAAKGLEFPVVFLVAFEEGLLPHDRAVEEQNIEEERRLVFVGMTRAREELYLTYARRRHFQGRTSYPAVSPFARELPSEAVLREDVHQVARSEFADYESQESYEDEFCLPVSRGSAEPSPSDQYRRGMLVDHPSYGRGTILQLEGVGESRKATIHFPTSGTKRFYLSIAPLEPASPEL
jgi:DNA helicase-2/ATP-dependent DNA helicase PcrA